MEPIFQILPILILLIGVFFIIRRGMRTDAHDRDTGGGDVGGSDGD